MNEHILKLAERFSKYPAGRQISDGPNSGERFRKEFLKPILESNQETVINFDGARGYGSSFLEEAFGGLIRDGYKIESIDDVFFLQSSDSSVIKEIRTYLMSAVQNLKED